MTNFNKYLYIIIGLAFTVILGYLSYVKNSRDNTLNKLNLANKRVEQLQTHIEKTNQQLKAIQLLDKDYQEKLQHAKTENDRLLNDLNNAHKRLYVKVKCPILPINTTATSGINAATRAELDRENAKRIIRITQDGDSAIMQLNALQKYVNETCLK